MYGISARVNSVKGNRYLRDTGYIREIAVRVNVAIYKRSRPFILLKPFCSRYIHTNWRTTQLIGPPSVSENNIAPGIKPRDRTRLRSGQYLPELFIIRKTPNLSQA